MPVKNCSTYPSISSQSVSTVVAAAFIASDIASTLNKKSTNMEKDTGQSDVSKFNWEVSAENGRRR